MLKEPRQETIDRNVGSIHNRWTGARWGNAEDQTLQRDLKRVILADMALDAELVRELAAIEALEMVSA